MTRRRDDEDGEEETRERVTVQSHEARTCARESLSRHCECSVCISRKRHGPRVRGASVPLSPAVAARVLGRAQRAKEPRRHGALPGRHSSRRSARASRRDLPGRRYPPPPPDMLATARSAIRLAPALRVGAHARARPVRGYSPIRRRDLTLPTFARASLGDARGRRPISSPVVSSRPGSASASRRRASAEGDGAGNRDDEEVSGQSSVAEAETNDADDADSYNVAEEMPDTIPYKSRDSADERTTTTTSNCRAPEATRRLSSPPKARIGLAPFFLVQFLSFFLFFCSFVTSCCLP